MSTTFQSADRIRYLRIRYLFAACKSLIVAIAPTVFMLRALSFTDMSHGWLHAFVASWNGPYSLTWFAAWTALALFAIPALFNAFIFLMSAIYPRNGAPFCLVDELMVNFACSRKEAKFIAVKFILIGQAFALVVVAWNLGEISRAVIDILTGHALYKDGFSLLAGAFFASACGYVMMRMAMTPGFGGGYSDDGYDNYHPGAGLLGEYNPGYWSDNMGRP